MSKEVTTSSLKTIFRFPFQGPNWQNRFLIGTVLTWAGFVIPIVPSILIYGYVLQVMRQAIEGKDLSLPDWDDWGKLTTDGLRATLVGMAYLMPAMIVFYGGMFLYFAFSFVFPLFMSVAEEGSDVMLLFPLLFVVVMGLMFLSMFLGWVLFFLGAIPLPMALSHLVAKDQVAAAFRVREWWRVLRANKLGYFIAWVIVAGLMAIWYFGFMMAYYTVVLCGVILLLSAPGSFYLLLVGSALFGQTYRESTDILVAGEIAVS